MKCTENHIEFCRPASSQIEYISGRATRSAGFTLIELMVVIVILGVLAGLVLPRIIDQPDKARVVKARMQMESISMALKQYKMDNGFYSTTEQGLQALSCLPPTAESAG